MCSLLETSESYILTYRVGEISKEIMGAEFHMCGCLERLGIGLEVYRLYAMSLFLKIPLYIQL